MACCNRSPVERQLSGKDARVLNDRTQPAVAEGGSGTGHFGEGLLLEIGQGLLTATS